MKRGLLSSSLLAAVSGVALCLAFPSFSFFPLAWISLIPYLYFLLKKPSWSATFVGHGVMSFVYFAGILYWIPRVLAVYGNLNWIVALTAYIFLIFFMCLLLLPFTLLTRWTAQRTAGGALLCAPGFWMLTEILRNYYPANGFPWALLGYSQYPYSWIIQVADVGGVYLVSFLVVAVNSAILALWLRSFVTASLFFAVFLVANAYGAHCQGIWWGDSNPGIKTTLVQPNIGLQETQDHYARKYFETLPDYYRSAVDEGTTWVIFPEAPNPFLYQEDFYFTGFWKRQLSAQPAYLLFNTTTVTRKPSFHYFNSAILLDPKGNQAYQYDKTHLVPFGEYVPLQDWLGLIFEPLVEEVSGYSPGQRMPLGEIHGTRFATLICYEGIFPELSREFVRQGAEILVNITNDTWYGQTAAPRQHLEMSAFRAIEYRKPLLRCANSGYSAIINPLGEKTQQLELFQEGVLQAVVAGNSYRSIYSYFGEWINISIVAATILWSTRLRFRGTGKRGRRKKSPAKTGKGN